MRRGARHSPTPPIERFLPAYEVRERHETAVAAPAEATWAAARALDLRESPLVSAIFRARELLMGARPRERRAYPDFVSELHALGWRVLAEEPGRLLVMGAIAQPWKPDVSFRGLGPEELVAFDRPGYAKIVWTLEVTPVGPDSSLFATETRVATTDPESRRRFRRYWSVLSPGIRLIRREVLRLVRREATRLAPGPGGSEFLP